MDLLNFEKENIIFNENQKYSVIEYTDTHGFTPEILKEKKNVVSLYQTSSIQDSIQEYQDLHLGLQNHHGL